MGTRRSYRVATSGVFRDIVLRIVGAFIGGIMMSVLGAVGQPGFVGSSVIAFIGATISGMNARRSACTRTAPAAIMRAPR